MGSFGESLPKGNLVVGSSASFAFATGPISGVYHLVQDRARVFQRPTERPTHTNAGGPEFTSINNPDGMDVRAASKCLVLHEARRARSQVAGWSYVVIQFFCPYWPALQDCEALIWLGYFSFFSWKDEKIYVHLFPDLTRVPPDFRSQNIHLRSVPRTLWISMSLNNHLIHVFEKRPCRCV